MTFWTFKIYLKIRKINIKAQIFVHCVKDCLSVYFWKKKSNIYILIKRYKYLREKLHVLRLYWYLCPTLLQN